MTNLFEPASKEDRAFIQQLIDDEYKDMKVGEKISFNGWSSNSPYLPSPIKIFEFLGVPVNITTTIKSLETMGIEPPKISRSTLYELQNRGIGVRSCKKLFNWLLKTNLSSNFLIKGKNPTLDPCFELNSNAFDWITFFSPFKTDTGGLVEHLSPEYKFVIEFIELRCSTEIALQQYIKNMKSSKSDLDFENPDIWWQQHAKPFFSENTVLPVEMLDSLDLLMADNSYADSLDKQNKNVLYKNLFRLKFDFLLGAIANYEVGCVICLFPETKSIKSRVGLVGKAISYYTTIEEDRTCFAWSLQVLKDELSEFTSDISWKKIADFIPVVEQDPNSSSGVTYQEKQYSRLKDWRKGKNLPSNKLLEEFITNLTQSIQVEYSEWILAHCLIAKGLDQTLTNLIRECSKEIGSKDEVKLVWKQLLRDYYNDYYLHYFNLHIAKIEKTT